MVDYYAFEEAMGLIESLERSLNLNLLDIKKSVENPDQRKKIRTLIECLDTLAKTKVDGRVFNLLKEVKGLREFLETLQKACDDPAQQVWLNKLSVEQIDVKVLRIIEALKKWEQLMKEKLVQGNKFLEDLPMPKEGFFFAYVKELSPVNVKQLHPVNPKQAENQMQRSTEDLIKIDPDDPISGYRVFGPHDDSTLPGSRIVLIRGHHRVAELYRCYLQGELSGETLVPILIKYAH